MLFNLPKNLSKIPPTNYFYCSCDIRSRWRLTVSAAPPLGL